MRGWHFCIEELPQCNPSDNRHWRHKPRDRVQWGILMRAALGRQPRPKVPLEHAHVECVRYSSRQADFENLAVSFKLVIDLLQVDGKSNPGGLGLIVNDGPASLTREYRWVQAPPKRGRIEITLTERAQKGPEAPQNRASGVNPRRAGERE